MHRQIPAHRAPRRRSYSRPFASIRGFNLPPPTAPVPSVSLRSSRLVIPVFRPKTPDPRPSFPVSFPSCTWECPCPRSYASTRSTTMTRCGRSEAKPNPPGSEPGTPNPRILNDLPRIDPEKKRSKSAPKRSKTVTKRSKHGPKTSKRPLNRSRIRHKGGAE